MKSTFLAPLALLALTLLLSPSRAASDCLKNVTCMAEEQAAGVEYCCGVATMTDKKYYYSHCIPTSGVGSIDQDGFTFNWGCMPATMACI